MRAFIYAEQFQEGTNFIGWIKTIMKTIYIGNYNHNKRVSRVFTLTPLFDNYDYTSHDSVSQVENKIMLERIKKMTSKLNGIHQKVISGILIEGSSYGEVSNETGVCFATTRSRLYRAKKMLRKINKKEIENERS
jgi:DNA-directed RNA polymerase specialized sigma24 family protein